MPTTSNRQIATLTATLAQRRGPSATHSQAQLAGIGTGDDGKDAADRGPHLRPRRRSRSCRARRSRRSRCSTSSSARSAPRSRALEQALEASEVRDTESRTAIADLGRRLNVALAQRVAGPEPLPLRLLRPPARDPRGPRRRPRRRRPLRLPVRSAVRSRPGRRSTPEGTDGARKARAARSTSSQREIPPDINWVLRIDGHTDKRPITNAQFPSQLGALARPAPSRSQNTSISAGRPREPPGPRRLRRVHPDRSGRQRRGLPPQPAHRVQADGLAAGTLTASTDVRLSTSSPSQRDFGHSRPVLISRTRQP